MLIAMRHNNQHNTAERNFTVKRIMRSIVRCEDEHSGGAQVHFLSARIPALGTESNHTTREPHLACLLALATCAPAASQPALNHSLTHSHTLEQSVLIRHVNGSPLRTVPHTQRDAIPTVALNMLRGRPVFQRIRHATRRTQIRAKNAKYRRIGPGRLRLVKIPHSRAPERHAHIWEYRIYSKYCVLAVCVLCACIICLCDRGPYTHRKQHTRHAMLVMLIPSARGCELTRAHQFSQLNPRARTRAHSSLCLF